MLFDIKIEHDTAINLLYYDYGPDFACASSYYVPYQVDLFNERNADLDYDFYREEHGSVRKIKWVMLGGDIKHARNIRKIIRPYTSTIKNTNKNK